jgi:hypothetical protein
VRLEPLSVFHWTYDEDVRVAAPGYAIVSAYGSEEGIGYSEEAGRPLQRDPPLISRGSRLDAGRYGR